MLFQSTLFLCVYVCFLIGLYGNGGETQVSEHLHPWMSNSNHLCLPSSDLQANMDESANTNTNRNNSYLMIPPQLPQLPEIPHMPAMPELPEMPTAEISMPQMSMPTTMPVTMSNQMQEETEICMKNNKKRSLNDMFNDINGDEGDDMVSMDNYNINSNNNNDNSNDYNYNYNYNMNDINDIMLNNDIINDDSIDQFENNSLHFQQMQMQMQMQIETQMQHNSNDNDNLNDNVNDDDDDMEDAEAVNQEGEEGEDSDEDIFIEVGIKS